MLAPGQACGESDKADEKLFEIVLFARHLKQQIWKPQQTKDSARS
jgi:hypothetical protein